MLSCCTKKLSNKGGSGGRGGGRGGSRRKGGPIGTPTPGADDPTGSTISGPHGRPLDFSQGGAN